METDAGDDGDHDVRALETFLVEWKRFGFLRR